MPALAVEDYHVGWICALPAERAAAKAMLDEEHEMILGQDHRDHNSYVLGRIQKHNVAIVCMPAGIDGLVAAATVAKDMARTLPAIRFGLMVGIGGGIPDLKNNVDIRLGDIVVSQPTGTNGGVIQYDKGKSTGKNLDDGAFIPKGALNAPPLVLLNALASLQADHDLRDSHVPEYLSDMLQRYPKMNKTGYRFPGLEKDCLYCGTCLDGKSCEECDQTLVRRGPRQETTPAIHYGVILSGNHVIKNAAVRDSLRANFGAKCVEMEAAGLMNNFPCIVIRGICDYADAHKNDTWHKYAAATAAAFAKELLGYISAEQTFDEKPIQQALDILNDHLQVSKEHLETSREIYRQNQMQYSDDEKKECHRTFRTSLYEEFKNNNPEREPGTCNWVLSHPQFCRWFENSNNDLLWISADPGCGKSVLAKSLVDNELQSTKTHTVCHFFFKDNDEQNTLETALSAILHQLFDRRAQLLRHAMEPWKKNGGKLTSLVDELWRIFMAAGTDPDGGKISCVLDALDECRQQDRLRLITLLSQFYLKSKSSGPEERWLKLLVTSRPYDDIQDQFHNITSRVPAIRLRGEDKNNNIRQEIDLVIQRRVQELAIKFALKEQTKQDLQQKLRSMENRTYLWLHLAVQSISETFRTSYQPDIESIVSLPLSVEGAYEKILNRVLPAQRGKVKLILQIIVGARRPLTIGEVALALGVATSASLQTLADLNISKDHLERHIRDWCGLFLFFSNSRIYLIHQTAKEFLIHNGEHEIVNSGWKSCLDLLGIERIMTEICVKYLVIRDLTRRVYIRHYGFGRVQLGPEGQDDINDFVLYSAEHWPSHFRSANLELNNPLMIKVRQLYDVDSERYFLWFRILWRTLLFNEKPEMTELRLAAFNGHDTVLQMILKDSSLDLDRSDSDGRTALIWASKHGYLKVASLLLENGADENAVGKYEPALHYASRSGHYEIVKLLVGHGAEVNAPGEHGTAFHDALKEHHVEVAKLLLDNGVDFTRGGDFGTPVQQAARMGNVEMMKLLLDKGADIGRKGGKRAVPLLRAVQYGRLEIAKLLLGNGADINAKSGPKSCTPLHMAVELGEIEMMKLLLERRADVNALDWQSNTPLHRAAELGKIKIMELERETRVCIDARDRRLKISRHMAAELGEIEIIKLLLLERRADVNALNWQSNTALLLALMGGRYEVVKLLLENGADVNATDKVRMHKAFIYGGKVWCKICGFRGFLERINEIASLLEKNGADLDESWRNAVGLPGDDWLWEDWG